MTTLRNPNVTILCSRCGSTEFQSSRLRFSDLGRLLRLQVPIRCRTCKHRRHASMLLAHTLAKPDYRAQKNRDR